MIQPSLDLRSPEELRDAGIADVTLSHERWIPLALEAIRSAAREHAELTSDEVREVAERLGVPVPKSPNAWGAAFTAAARARIIAPTDRVRKSTRPAAQAHRNSIWTRGEAA